MQVNVVTVINLYDEYGNKVQEGSDVFLTLNDNCIIKGEFGCRIKKKNQKSISVSSELGDYSIHYKDIKTMYIKGVRRP